MTKADDVFVKQFGMILVLIVIFGFAMFFLSRSIGLGAHERMRNSPGAVQMRIAPVAQVRIGDPAATVAAAAPVMAAAAPAASAKSGADIVQSACAACHVAGVAGAPKLDDKAAWSARADQGLAALVASVVNGKGAMPPKGGNPSLTEQDIEAAVIHMLEGAGLDAGAGASAATQVQAVAGQVQAAAGEVQAAAGEVAAAAGQAVEKAVEKVADTATEAAAQVAQTTAAAATAVTEQVAAATGMAAGGAKADAAAGEAVVAQACAACHIAGVAGAPKTGDKAAWEPRAALGFDALVASVLNGKGAMPPKGGNMALTEEQIRNAVAHFLTTAGLEP